MNRDNFHKFIDGYRRTKDEDSQREYLGQSLICLFDELSAFANDKTLEATRENRRLRSALTQCIKHAEGRYQTYPSDRLASIAVLCRQTLDNKM
jgi:hypothetical protein